MSLTYTTGNPANLTAGATASMTDISGPFTDIKTFLTDGSGAVGDTILTSPTSPVWRTVFSHQFNLSGLSTTKSFFNSSGTNVASASVVLAAQGLWVPVASDVAVTSKTARLRLRVHWATNLVAPGVDMTFGIYPVSATTGAAGSSFGVTLGTVAAGSTVTVPSPGVAVGATSGSSFDYSTVSTGGLFVTGVVASGAMSGTSSVAGQLIVEMRHT